MNAQRSLRMEINIAILSAWLIIFIIQIVCVSMLYNQTVLDTQTKISDNVAAAQNIIEKKINEATMIQNSIVNNAEVIRYLHSEVPDRQSKIWQLLSQLIQVNRSVMYEQFYIILVDANGEASCVSSEVPPEEMQKALESCKNPDSDDKEKLVFFTKTKPIFSELYFCIPRQVNIPSTDKVGMQFLGTFVVVGRINTTDLIRQSALSEKAHLFLRNGDDSENDITITPNTSKNNSFFLWGQRFTGTNWRLGISTPLSFPITAVFLMFQLELVLLPIIFIFIQRFITRRIYNPIRRIYEFLSRYSARKKHSRIRLQNHTEIGIIADKIDEMLDNTENLYSRIVQTQQTLYENELAQKNTMLYALQAQLNPHFIYNTLDCVCGLANTSGVPQIADVIVSLAKMLRYSISEEKTVLFRQEIEILEHYLTIQNIIRPNQFTVTLQVPEDTLDTPCLKMLLQPIVENSFKHGFKNRRKHAQLIISAQAEGDFLIVRIHDNGCGMSKEKLDEITRDLCEIDKTFFVENDNTQHIGLANIQHRIRMNYGRNYGLSIKSKESEFTEIELYLPRLSEQGS